MEKPGTTKVNRASSFLYSQRPTTTVTSSLYRSESTSRAQHPGQRLADTPYGARSAVAAHWSDSVTSMPFSYTAGRQPYRYLKAGGGTPVSMAPSSVSSSLPRPVSAGAEWQSRAAYYGVRSVSPEEDSGSEGTLEDESDPEQMTNVATLIYQHEAKVEDERQQLYQNERLARSHHADSGSTSLGRSESLTRSQPDLYAIGSLSLHHRIPKQTIIMGEDEGVGFGTLPEQVHRKALKHGFDFTLMVVGESGLGKSTLIQSLFLTTDLYKERQTSLEEPKKTVGLEKRFLEIEEQGVKVRLSIVDTPGYNDSINAEDNCEPIEEYINQQFSQYYSDETGINRKNIKDNRVHCCLYFISPCAHGLKPVDLHFMKRLHQKVNIVPVIAKADTCSKQELETLKERVRQQILVNTIKIYEFSESEEDDESTLVQTLQLKAAVPFAVVGSNMIVEVAGRKIRGRVYPWGIVEVDNPDHCDFTKLRQMLISTHMQDLKDVTHDVHYENYRANYIHQSLSGSNTTKDPSSPYIEVSNSDVSEKLLQEKDLEIQRMQEKLLLLEKQLRAKESRVRGGPLNYWT